MRGTAALTLILLLTGCGGDASTDAAPSAGADTPAPSSAGPATSAAATPQSGAPDAQPAASEPGAAGIGEPSAGAGTAATGTSGTGATGTGMTDPCALLTAGELQDATGLPFGAGTPNEALSAGEAAACDWVSDSPFATAQTLLIPGGDLEANRDSADQIAGETRDVEVPGAEAAYQTPEGNIVAMTVGDLFIQVSVISSEERVLSDETLALATLVAGRV